MAHRTKWISATGDEPVAEVAARSLKSRLEPVQHFLPLAAKKYENDIEYVHQLRVWTRRADAAIEMYRELLSDWRAAWIEKQLGRIRKATNDSRDDDVFVQRLADDEAPAAAKLLKRVSAHRVEAQQQLLEVFGRLHRKGRFDRRVAKLVKRVRPRGKLKGVKLSFSEWSQLRFQPIVCDFFEAGRADLSVNDKLHQFRLEGKRLRYAMELLASAFPDELRNDVYPLLSELQEKLGEINDHATAETRIQHWIEEDDKPKEVVYLQNLLEDEQHRLKEKRAAFFAWWTPDHVQRMQAAFDKMFEFDCTKDECVT